MQVIVKLDDTNATLIIPALQTVLQSPYVETDSRNLPLSEGGKPSAKMRHFSMGKRLFGMIANQGEREFTNNPISVNHFLNLPKLATVDESVFSPKGLSYARSKSYDLPYLAQMCPRNKQGKITSRQIRTIMG